MREGIKSFFPPSFNSVIVFSCGRSVDSASWLLEWSVTTMDLALASLPHLPQWPEDRSSTTNSLMNPVLPGCCEASPPLLPPGPSPTPWAVALGATV